jgi:hypothetical protein
MDDSSRPSGGKITQRASAAFASNSMRDSYAAPYIEPVKRAAFQRQEREVRKMRAHEHK